MISTITFNTFHDAFRDCGRVESFTYNGFKALFEYLETLEEECDTTIELDPIAFDCEFIEYFDFEEIQKDYSDIKTMDQLQDNTTVIEFNEGIIISAF